MKTSILFAILLSLCANHLRAQEIFLSWDKNKESDLKGYKIYLDGALHANVGLGLPDPENPLRVKHAINFNWQENREYIFNVSAYDTLGAESGLSNDAKWIVSIAPNKPTGVVVTIKYPDGKIVTFRSD